MRYIFNFPDIGEGLDEGTIVEWYVSKGQQINSGDSLVKMETDKVVADIPSPKSGVIAAIYGKVGETIHVGNALVEIEIEGVSGAAAIEEAAPKEAVKEEGAGVVGTLEIAGNNAFLPASEEGTKENQSTTEKTTKKVLATPVARAVAKDLGVNINMVTGSGPAGRVMKEDVHAYLQKNGTSSPGRTVQQTVAEDRVELKPLTQLRKTIAKNMLQSKHNAAHMTVFDEVEVSELVRIREKYKEIFLKKEVKLSYLPFVLKATALALKKFKALNAQMDMENNQMIYKNYYNIGIAVDTEDGLIVPVIKDVDKLSILQIAQKINEISEKARKREVSMEDMKDGTFTITSFGSIGGQFAVPVINYPQAAILGIGRILKKPVVKGDAVVPGTIMPLSLSVDHRIVDGGETARFINQIMEYLSDPVSLIMD
ncbi:MAG: dihydrolipoamide acetyltransferase family protein [Bacteroidetes bacterium]|nr:dihydrolipoamide acetyltransferase family protein [Bacteroidota bacterium]